MRRYLLSLLILATGLALSCRKVYPPEPAPGGAVCPQVDIPWPSLADSPWPMHHHDPQSTGRSPYIGPQQGSIVWKLKVGGPVSTSVAIGPDSTIYFATSYDTTEGWQSVFLYAVDWNGNLKWRRELRSPGSHAYPDQACSPLVAADGTIYLGSRDHLVYAINPDGTLKWTFEAGDDIDPISLNIGLDGTIYFTAADGFLYALSAAGELIWKSGGDFKFSCNPSGGISISPDGSTLYVPFYGTSRSDSTGLAAVDLNGRVRWAFYTGLVDGTPVVDNQGNIFFGAGRGLGSVDEDQTGMFSVNSQGVLRWKYPAAYMISYEATIDYDGNVYFSVWKTRSEAVLVSLTNDGEVRWEINTYEVRRLTSSLVCDAEGTIYGFSWPGSFYLFALTSGGQLRWTAPIGQVAVNSPALAHGRLLAGTWFRNPGKELVCVR